MLYIAEHTTLIPRSMDKERYRNILSHKWRMPRVFLLAFTKNDINDGPEDYLDLFEQFIDYPSDPEEVLTSSANSETPVYENQKPPVKRKDATLPNGSHPKMWSISKPCHHGTQLLDAILYGNR